jgi:hypothetical protein
MHGERLIPAPQETSVGMPDRKKHATVSTAARISHAELPGPSINGKRQSVRSRGRVAGDSSSAKSTMATMPVSTMAHGLAISPT